MSIASAAVTAAAAAYLIGSTPVGLLLARAVAGVDIRRAGSGNIGATNVARVLGPRWGLVVLLLDCAKGAAAVAVLPAWLLPADSQSQQHVQVLCGFTAVIGHMFPVWLWFRGGKGVATSLGVVAVLAPWATLAAIGIFAIAVGATRIVAVGSLTAAIAFPAVEFWLLRPAPFSDASWSLAAISLLVPLLIVVRHRANLRRLLRGEEPRFRFGGPKSGEATGERAA